MEAAVGGKTQDAPTFDRAKFFAFLRSSKAPMSVRCSDLQTAALTIDPLGAARA